MLMGAGTVRGLKSLVIVQGVLLFAGLVALVAGVAWRGTHRPAQAPVAVHPVPAGPYEAALDLPQGAALVSLAATGDRVVLHLRLADGREQLAIVDMGTGARLGTIELRNHP
jgi:flagellar basal body-associated protein FliL